MVEDKVLLDDLKKIFDFDELEIPLQCADTIPKVMRVIQQHSSFINCFYLERVTARLGILAAKEEIDAYYNYVKTFCDERLKEHSYVIPFLANQSRHLISETITFTLEWTPNEKTLANIQGLLRKTFKSLASRIHIVVVGGGSVTVTCYAPQYLMGALVRLAQENMKVLVKSKVTYLSVGHAVLLDKSIEEVNTNNNFEFYNLNLKENWTVFHTGDLLKQQTTTQQLCLNNLHQVHEYQHLQSNLLFLRLFILYCSNTGNRLECIIASS